MTFKPIAQAAAPTVTQATGQFVARIMLEDSDDPAEVHETFQQTAFARGDWEANIDLKLAIAREMIDYAGKRIPELRAEKMAGLLAQVMRHADEDQRDFIKSILRDARETRSLSDKQMSAAWRLYSDLVRFGKDTGPTIEAEE